MVCSQCGGVRIVSIYAKCNDLFVANQYNTGVEYEGYVPTPIGIGGGDDVQFDYCLDCGQIQNWVKAEDL